MQSAKHKTLGFLLISMHQHPIDAHVYAIITIRNPVEIAKIQQRMAKIRVQLEKLHADLRMAEIRDGLSFSRLKPK
jgi:hypothetical protein